MNCLHCNKPIEGKRNTKRYCGNTCKQYAYLKRSFTLPSDVNSVSLNNSENTTSQEKNNITLKPINNHGYKPQIIEQEYEYINPDILDAIQSASIFINESSNYFTTTANNGGRITPQNFSAFTYIVPRLRCIIENLFQLSYKRKLHYQTANAISKAVEEMCLSDHIKQLPSDFPFFEDLLKLHEQFKPIADYLKENAEGIKFRLTKPAIVRYIMILKLIRDCAKREAFSKLFPEISKTKPV
jgi:hypothetical protein